MDILKIIIEVSKEVSKEGNDFNKSIQPINNIQFFDRKIYVKNTISTKLKKIKG